MLMKVTFFSRLFTKEVAKINTSKMLNLTCEQKDVVEIFQCVKCIWGNK